MISAEFKMDTGPIKEGVDALVDLAKRAKPTPSERASAALRADIGRQQRAQAKASGKQSNNATNGH